MPKTPFQRHKEEWCDCQLCPLHRSRHTVVLCRGVLPAEVLFIGEAPGDSEDLLGVPFIGPAGKLLDKFIAMAKEASGVTPTLCWTNLVACAPPKDDERRKNREPLAGEIASCWPRLDEFIDICKPKLIIATGGVSEKQAKKQLWSRRAKVIGIKHPSAILQAKIEQKGLDAQRVVIQLTDAFRELIPF